MRRLALSVAALAVVASGLTACSDKTERWCEHDATDTVVADSFCEKKTSGYDWEEGSSGGTKVKKKSKKK
ncbi:hypothetical protein [Actinocorallia populi]|uniref:hypothetical protein n=1 Tax=Actinocorallia populi TaxID=2079200 RepID=UPI000D08EE9E|nr:hypothetical protein [Actinocorallia populi]